MEERGKKENLPCVLNCFLNAGSSHLCIGLLVLVLYTRSNWRRWNAAAQATPKRRENDKCCKKNNRSTTIMLVQTMEQRQALYKWTLTCKDMDITPWSTLTGQNDCPASTRHQHMLSQGCLERSDNSSSSSSSSSQSYHSRHNTNLQMHSLVTTTEQILPQ